MSAKSKPKAKPKSQLSIVPSQEHGAHWVVEFTKVALRDIPSTTGAAMGVLMKGEALEGAVHDVSDGKRSTQWVKVDLTHLQGSITEVCEEAWALINGESVGLGVLLRPASVQEVQQKLSKRQSKPAASQPEKPPAERKAVEKAPSEGAHTTADQQRQRFLDNLAPKADAQEDEDDTPVNVGPATGPLDEYVVVHEKVVVRQSPKTTADMVKVMNRGALVEGTPHLVDGVPWLKAEVQKKLGGGTAKGWMLIDGAHVNLGILLQPAMDITDDVMKWAERQKTTARGQNITWTEATEAEIQRLEVVTREQVDTLSPMLNSSAVLKELRRSGILGDSDVSLGLEGVYKKALGYLLRRRLGVLVLGEDPPFAADVWPEDKFSTYMVETVERVAPFFCRSLVPENAQRVLVLLHGGYVRGDDLVDQAEILQKMMPDCAIFLPEAPFVINSEYELRVWWESSKPAEGVSIREMVDQGILKASDTSISRLVATLLWVRGVSGNLPLVIGGFSQGSMLAAQSLTAIRQADICPVGLMILSGLVQQIEKLEDSHCYVVHGDKDDRIPFDLAEEVAKQMKEGHKNFVFESVRGLGHEINDKILDQMVDFANRVMPVSREAAALEVQKSEIQQTKVLRWVKEIARVTKMFDSQVFLEKVLVENMVGLGPDCPTIGGGLFRYYMHDAGPENRGTVVLFHGKVADLRKETDPLAHAYMKALQMNVVIIDYRLKFSALALDAQIALEALPEITGSSKPLIIHAVGIGAIAGIHIAMVACTLPPAFKRRFRLLVLDGPVATFKSLPPMPTGCIAVDPIGNDAKLEHVGWPVVLLGGDDDCCGIHGHNKTHKHYAVMSRNCEMMKSEGKMKLLGMSDCAALTSGNLSQVLFDAVTEALETVTEENTKKSSNFVATIAQMEANDGDDGTKEAPFKEEELLEICSEAVKKAGSPACLRELWELRRMREPARGNAALEHITKSMSPLLKKNGKFKDGTAGFQQLEVTLAMMGEDSPKIAEAHQQLRDAFSLEKLDRIVLEVCKDEPELMKYLEMLHNNLEVSIAEWGSKEMLEKLRAGLHEAGASGLDDAHVLSRIMATKVLPGFSAEMNIKRAREMGFVGTDADVEASMNAKFGKFVVIDKSLSPKMMRVQAAVHAATSKAIEKVNDFVPPARKPEQSEKVTASAPTAAAKAEAIVKPEVSIIVYIDRELAISTTYKLRGGSTIADLKQLIAQDDMSGGTAPESIKLMTATGVLQTSATRLTDDAEFDLCET